MNTNLSKRLLALLDLIPNDTIFLADVGADHGYLICEAYRLGKIKKGMAIENKKGPFFRLNDTIKKYGFERIIATSLSDGLKQIENADTIVIAGMGGYNIIDILNKDYDKMQQAKYLLIDAHSNILEVRRYLTNHHFMIEKEVEVYEDKVYYELLLCVKGDREYDEDDYFFGPLLRMEKPDLYIDKWVKTMVKYEQIMINENLSKERKEEITQLIRRIKNNI